MQVEPALRASAVDTMVLGQFQSKVLLDMGLMQVCA
jgi:hypothetical protein